MDSLASVLGKRAAMPSYDASISVIGEMHENCSAKGERPFAELSVKTD